ncbi:MAG: hypothetical protein LBJ39_04460, partial [Tannerellaceae bacterium]|nr:hypothetical protein [Tannerellaceae bacterium]
LPILSGKITIANIVILSFFISLCKHTRGAQRTEELQRKARPRQGTRPDLSLYRLPCFPDGFGV